MGISKARYYVRGEGGGNLAMGLCLIQGGVVILLVSSCLGNRDELWLGGPLSLRTDFIFNSTLKSFLEIKNSWLWPFCLSFQDFNVDSLHCWHWNFTLEIFFLIWHQTFHRHIGWLNKIHANLKQFEERASR